MFKTIFAFLFLTASFNVFAGTPVLKQTFFKDTEVREVTFADSSQARLSTLINIDDYLDLERSCIDERCEITSKSSPAPHNLCFTGDIKEVCPLLSRMYQKDKKQYGEGDHEITKLLACNVMRGQKEIFIRIETIQDFERVEITAQHKLSNCSPIAK